MKIEIEVNDIKLFAKGLNNAIATYGHIIRCVDLGCNVPSQFEVMNTIPFEELRSRYNCLIDVYEQIERIEKDFYK